MTPAGEKANPRVSTTRLFHKYPPSLHQQLAPSQATPQLKKKNLSEVNSRVTASHRPQYLPTWRRFTLLHAQDGPGSTGFSPVMCSRSSLLASLVEGRRWCSGSPARLQATKDGSTGWGAPSEPTQKWLQLDLARSGLRASRHPRGALAAADRELSTGGAHLCPHQPASEIHTETWPSGITARK